MIHNCLCYKNFLLVSEEVWVFTLIVETPVRYPRVSPLVSTSTSDDPKSRPLSATFDPFPPVFLEISSIIFPGLCGSHGLPSVASSRGKNGYFNPTGWRRFSVLKDFRHLHSLTSCSVTKRWSSTLVDGKRRRRSRCLGSLGVSRPVRVDGKFLGQDMTPGSANSPLAMFWRTIPSYTCLFFLSYLLFRSWGSEFYSDM